LLFIIIITNIIMGRQTGTPCNTLAPHLWSCFGWCHGWGL